MMMNDELTFLRDYVAVYSPTGEEGPAAELLVGQFEQWGWRARIDEVGNAVAEVGDGPTVLCFLGHIDTVRGEIPVRVEDGVLYGRGSVDAKGPLAAFACALRRCEGELENLTVRLIGAVEEESRSSLGARFAVEKYGAPDLLVIGEPSGASAITLGYKGVFHFAYRLRQSCRHGAAAESLPATKAVDFWHAMFREFPHDPDRPSSPFHNLTGNVRSMQTGGDDEWETVELVGDVRVPPRLDPGRLREWAERRALEDGAELECHELLPAVRCARGTLLANVFGRAIRDAGEKLTVKVKTGTTDMNIAVPAWQCPALAYGPGDSHLDHTPDERLELDEFRQSVDIIERALRALDAKLQPRHGG
ncbi:[LysW]-lysine hydrolase [Candidatus Sumerlaeota bacterium]